MKKKERLTIYCPVCEKTFIQKYAYRKEKYCSRECWSKRNPPEIINCDFCGKEFTAWISTLERKRFCSKTCYSLHQTGLTGENSHLWKGGKTKIHQLERTRAKYIHWRDSVFERDGYKCQKCAAVNGNGKRIILNAHHIQLFSKDEDKRFELDNGITLCKSCHILEHPHLIKQIAVRRLAQDVLRFE